MTRTRKLLFGTLAVALGLGLLEAGAWLWERGHPAPPPSGPLLNLSRNRAVAEDLQRDAEARHMDIPMVEDQAYGWKLPQVEVMPYWNLPFRVNSDGFRGPEITEKPEGTLRIFTLGDSSIFGDGVPERYVLSSVAASRLSQDWGRPVEPVIGAMPGFDSAQSLQVLARLGPRVQPDWVVIGNLWSDVYAGSGTYRVREIQARWARGPLQRTATYRVLVRLFTPWLRTRAVSFVTSDRDLGAPGGKDARVQLQAYARNLASLADGARDLGARVVFLVLPAPADTQGVVLPETLLQYREAMRVVARRSGALLVDGPALFREKSADRVSFADQLHPSALGHQILGEALAEVIRADGVE